MGWTTRDIPAMRDDGMLVSGRLDAYEPAASEPHRYIVKVSLPGVGDFESAGHDILDCVDKLRDILDPMGVLLCINACRLHSFVSGMARDMGRGFSVYLVIPEPTPRLGEVVQSLDPAPPESVTTRVKQEKYRRALFESGVLRRPRA